MSRLRLGLLLVVGVWIVSVLPASASTQTPGEATLIPSAFSDTVGSVFANAIDWLADQGITQGCNPPANTHFCPNDVVTRGQMAVFISRALGLPAPTDDHFVDDTGSFYEGAANRLIESGITAGCNPPANDRFCGDDLVTRGQMAAFLVRGFDLPDTVVDFFADDQTSQFATAINRIAAAGVTVGCNPPANDRFCPNDFVIRGQMAAFFKRALIPPANQPPVAWLQMAFTDSGAFEGDTLIVNGPPNDTTIMIFNSCNPAFGCSSDPDGQVRKWEWFLDGVLINVNSEFLYQTSIIPAGLHQVTLRVTDDDGATDEAPAFIDRVHT